MEEFINPEEYLEEQKKKIEAEREQEEGQVSRASRERDVLLFLIEHAPLERWERDVLEHHPRGGLLLRRRRCRRRS